MMPKCTAHGCRRAISGKGYTGLHFCAWHFTWIPKRMRFAIACQFAGAVAHARVYLSKLDAVERREKEIQK